MKGLCLSLAGASKLQELSIIVKPGDQDSSDVDLADILWPLILLRSGIKVRFDGITTDLEKASTTENERNPDSDEEFCGHIARARQLCSSEFEKYGWEERSWAFHGLREAEFVLSALQSLGKKVLCLDDIVNMSPVWKDLQGDIDRAEASDAEQ
jgi:hypothetical protein